VVHSFHRVFLAAASAGTFPGLPVALRLACRGLTGLLIVRLFVIYHDQQHHAILPKSPLAELFMRHSLPILFGYIFVFLLGVVICPIFNSPCKHYECLPCCCT